MGSRAIFSGNMLSTALAFKLTFTVLIYMAVSKAVIAYYYPGNII